MIKKNISIVILTLLSYFTSFSQDSLLINTTIKDLNRKLSTSDINKKTQILNRLSDAYLDISNNKAEALARKALKLSIEIKNYKEEANAYINLGNAVWNTGISDSVLYYYTKSLKVYEVNYDSIGIADSFNRIGLVHEHTNNYDKALNNMNSALVIYNNNNNIRGESKVENNLGIVYNNIGDTKEALFHYKKAQRLFKELNNKNDEANVINNIGTIYSADNQQDSAIYMFKRAAIIHKELSNRKALATVYANLAPLYVNKGDFMTASQYFQKALDIQEDIENLSGISSVKKQIGDMYLQRKLHNKALTFYNSTIEIDLQINNLSELSDTYYSLSLLYESINKPIIALKYYKLYIDAWKKVYNIKKEEQLAEITTKYKIEEKVKKVILLQKEVEAQKSTQLMLFILIIGLVFFIGFIILSLRLKSKLLMQNKLAYKQKEELAQLNIKNKEEENKRLQAETKQKEIEKKLLKEDIKKQQKINELQKEKHKLALEHKNKELVTSTLHLANKNKVLNDIKRSIENEYNSEKIAKQNLGQIIREINSNINMDNEWDDFKKHFEEVNNDFFSKLQSKYPKLTKNDYKLCAYMRMNLSSKEIAQILNITLSAVSKSRNRLRKKMDLDSSVKLTQFMMDL